MKNLFYISMIFIFAITIVDLTDMIIISTYDIPKDIVETDQFRKMDINEKSIGKGIEFSDKNNIEKSRLLSVNFLKNDFDFKKQNFTLKEYRKWESSFKRVNPQEYAKVCNAMAAIFDDLQYFPVAKSSLSKFWVSYADSFGADRNYNGAYQHEGTDLMAQNNVQGYYPIVSVTDGVVENIGWLEKGGYRVGIRGISGGYFYYAHLSSYSDIKKGDKVKAGTLLGYMGDTGYGKTEGTRGKFAVHLHFGIYIKTKNYEELSINPYHILKYLESKLIIANY